MFSSIFSWNIRCSLAVAYVVHNRMFLTTLYRWLFLLQKLEKIARIDCFEALSLQWLYLRFTDKSSSTPSHNTSLTRPDNHSILAKLRASLSQSLLLSLTTMGSLALEAAAEMKRTFLISNYRHQNAAGKRVSSFSRVALCTGANLLIETPQVLIPRTLVYTQLDRNPFSSKSIWKKPVLSDDAAVSAEKLSLQAARVD